MTRPQEDRDSTGRLSRIATQWTVLLQAHGDESSVKRTAKEAVLQRYASAVYRYLLGAVRNADVAEELCQEFAVSFLKGDFHRVNPDRGRFRNYLKTVLINLVNRHFNQLKKAPSPISPDGPEPAAEMDNVDDGSFEDCLRDDLLTETWSALARVNPNYHAALLLRVEQPDLASKAMAEQLSKKLDKAVTGDWVRKTVERARVKFAELLAEEVRRVLECSSDEELYNELDALQLLPYCRHVLQQ